MKSLLLFRHGKSSWDYDVRDQDRPLKPRGIKDGHLVASTFMKNTKELPDRVFSSIANRALHTCMIFCRTLEYPMEKVSLTPSLYDFSGDSALGFVKGLDNSLNSVAIFGHNYAFTNIANQLGSMHIDNIPTSGLVKINFQVDNWKKLDKGTTELILFPKEIR
ncbi:SixA phosphatase family protein [Lentiprolixibacter aurantiacus]|uniref:Histidine phosphatase family protein n=1 Tax=Lentiprolixibacter aurantiacus TaxID=2993939 RepID=A0AAE3SPZ0_9FLAO|nr:histidine phosphatase family protein [Lentiprolixibacter aurantiacus]MCX2719957.1 histidine phosphatase family protein [Lentiprolixibacter aurantiacus]